MELPKSLDLSRRDAISLLYLFLTNIPLSSPTPEKFKRRRIFLSGGRDSEGSSYPNQAVQATFHVRGNLFQVPADLPSKSAFITERKDAQFQISTFPMSTKNFVVETLVFPGVFPRGHPRITLSPNDRLDIVVNKYSPKSNPNPKTGDVTLILLHANGFHKACCLSMRLTVGII